MIVHIYSAMFKPVFGAILFTEMIMRGRVVQLKYVPEMVINYMP